MKWGKTRHKISVNIRIFFTVNGEWRYVCLPAIQCTTNTPQLIRSSFTHPSSSVLTYNTAGQNPADYRIFEGRAAAACISWHPTTPTPTPTSSPTYWRRSSRECRRVVQLATGITSGNRASDVSARISVSVSVSASWNSSYTIHQSAACGGV